MDELGNIFDSAAPVVYFPVRHHSPTAARLVRDLIRSTRPAAVLIEGPSDFNDRLDELALPHKLPIAVYSYVRLPGGGRRGAYYPFCVYSPEWQAFVAGRAAGAAVRFIDLPYADVAGEDDHVNRYADADLRRGRYVKALCGRLGVEGFDGLWDALVEIEADLGVGDYLRRAHQLCGHIRLLEGPGRPADRRREAFMAAQVRAAVDEFPGRQVLVVTGGYHSIALHARLDGGTPPVAGIDDPADYRPAPAGEGEERGIALTPYSYERLDALKGYEAGMPNPGFYDRLWQDREAARDAGRPAAPTHRQLLTRVARMLRERKQRVSSADLIAAEACTAGLARLRGHAEVWRSDLVDGITGALLKDESAAAERGAAGGAGAHPLLDAVHEVLRGDERGALAAGTALPPLVRDMRRELEAHGLLPDPKARTVELDLSAGGGREATRLLHRLRILRIAGYQRTAGTDFALRDDLSRVWERWEVRWSPDFDSTSVEAARYGPTVAEAAAARLAEQAAAAERSAPQGAALLLEAALAGLDDLAGELHRRVTELVRQEPQFLGVTGALGHLLYLYRYDEALGTAGRADVGALLAEAFGRGMWLLETLGQVADTSGQFVTGVARLLETFERCDEPLGLDRAELAGVLVRVRVDGGQGPAVRGAAAGALWRLGDAAAAHVRDDLRLFADPDRLGDFLSGLFALAREIVQRDPALIRALDGLLAGYADEQFLAALPSLRLAFTFFTPREKHYLALNLRESMGGAGSAGAESAARREPLAALEVRPEDAARALALEARVFAALKLYGLRGRADPSGDEP